MCIRDRLYGQGADGVGNDLGVLHQFIDDDVFIRHMRRGGRAGKFHAKGHGPARQLARIGAAADGLSLIHISWSRSLALTVILP